MKKISREQFDKVFEANGRADMALLAEAVGSPVKPLYRSLFIHPDGDSVNVDVEAYDGAFYDVMRGESKARQVRQQTEKMLARVLPFETVVVTWYSGFNYVRESYISNGMISS